MARFSNSVRFAVGFLAPWKVRSLSRMIPLHRRHNACGLGMATVWASPLSLTTTQGISYDFFSSGY